MIIDMRRLYRKYAENRIAAVAATDPALHARRIFFLNGLEEKVSLPGDICIL
jgi:hypothetical protein